MIMQFIAVGILMLLSAMLPGPDFAMVTRNTLFYSRRIGMMTALGVGCALMVHVSYCALGLAAVIMGSKNLFHLIRYAGAAWLVWLGIQSFFFASSKPLLTPGEKKLQRAAQGEEPHPDKQKHKKRLISSGQAWRQGFLCNLMNPKAAVFVLALYSMAVKPETPAWGKLVIAAEFFFISTGWFFVLAWILSHPAVTNLLELAEKYIARGLGLCLMFFGVMLLVA